MVIIGRELKEEAQHFFRSLNTERAPEKTCVGTTHTQRVLRLPNHLFLGVQSDEGVLEKLLGYWFGLL